MKKLAAIFMIIFSLGIGGAFGQSSNHSDTMTLTVYLLFDGNCQQAMEFYKSCLGGELLLTKAGDSPMKSYVPLPLHDRIVNAQLESGGIHISASDWLRPDQKATRGNTVCLYLSGGSREELKALFIKLSDSAEVTDPLRVEPFGMYGALNDKFGIRWMFQTFEN